ncbi:MAG: ExbD/TolR family protein [Candidatus Zhuqueibacterota bacterium]
MFADRKKSRPSEIPTASLADIAFLILIFFLVTTTIDVDKGISLALPPRGEHKEVPRKNISRLLMDESGRVMIDDELVEIPMIKSDIQTKLQKNPNLIISVKTAQDTEYRYFVQVLDQLKQAKATRISIAEPEQ